MSGSDEVPCRILNAKRELGSINLGAIRDYRLVEPGQNAGIAVDVDCGCRLAPPSRRELQECGNRVPTLWGSTAMAEVLLFHHAHGLTTGVVGFADELRRAGHSVHIPDLYEGQTFEDLEAGVGYAQEVGFRTIIDRGVDAAGELSDGLVYAGFSLGVLPAQKLAQTRPGATGALLFSACVPPSEFDSIWPDALPLQIHGMDTDEFFAGEGDLDAAQELVDGHDDRQLFLYEGSKHLFADASLPSYDKVAATLLTRRVLEFLGAVS